MLRGCDCFLFSWVADISAYVNQGTDPVENLYQLFCSWLAQHKETVAGTVGREPIRFGGWMKKRRSVLFNNSIRSEY